MRFYCGDKVEVMNHKEVPVSWRRGEILSSSDRTYRVRYDHHPAMARDQSVEMVQRKFVRPNPPLVQGPQSFNTGDIVEVFYQYSWKIAAILNILEGRQKMKKNTDHLNVASFQNQYIVRLLGCSREFVIDRSIIRMRQTWSANKWILMEKRFRAGDDLLASKPNFCRQMKVQAQQFKAGARNRWGKDANIKDDAALRGSPVISSRSLKRVFPYESPIIEEHNGHVHKRRVTVRQGWKQRVIAHPFPEKNMDISLRILLITSIFSRATVGGKHRLLPMV